MVWTKTAAVHTMNSPYSSIALSDSTAVSPEAVEGKFDYHDADDELDLEECLASPTPTSSVWSLAQSHPYRSAVIQIVCLTTAVICLAVATARIKRTNFILAQHDQAKTWLPYGAIFSGGGDITWERSQMGYLYPQGKERQEEHGFFYSDEGDDEWTPARDEQFMMAIEDKGSREIQHVEAAAELLPLCDRTLLVDWSTFAFGFGSGYFTVLQAALFASRNNYTLLFTRDANNYGRYLDYFVPPALNCRTTEEMYNMRQCWEGKHCREVSETFELVKKGKRPTGGRYSVGQRNVLGLNIVLVQTYYWPDRSILSRLAPPDSQRPQPFSLAVPTVMRAHFDEQVEASTRLFTYNRQVQARIAQGRQQLNELLEEDDISIGVLYRGGDKLLTECTPSPRVSCGNITLHAEAAYESYLAVAQARGILDVSPRKKPKLILMTIEPGIFGRFKRDRIGQMFDVIEMPGETQDQSFTQLDFNLQSLHAKVENTRSMLASIEILSLYVDGFIVSANSNLGRLAMLRGGQQRLDEGVKVRPFDIYYHPTLWKPIWPECDGTDKCVY